MQNASPTPVPNLEKMRTALHELRSSKRNVSRAAFDMLLPDIKQALMDEHPVKTIWKSLHQQGLELSLATFRKWLAERTQQETN